MSSSIFKPTLTHGVDETKRSHFIFGYGSLIERASRLATAPQATAAFPVTVSGIQRGWFDRVGTATGLTPTYLGAVENRSSKTNGVVYAVSQSEMDQFQQRESGYNVKKIDVSQFEFLDGRSKAPNANFFFFESKDPQSPTEQYPIVQSYVDIVMTGALEQEADYPRAQEAGFVQTLIKTTTDWSAFWINDRIHPYRAFAAIPAAHTIDGLLSKAFPQWYPARSA